MRVSEVSVWFEEIIDALPVVDSDDFDSADLIEVLVEKFFPVGVDQEDCDLLPDSR